jgi:histidinol-phosphatase (PHP family)
MIDLHNHSYFSPDSEAPLEGIVAKALREGLSIIGISDHDDLDTSFSFSYRLKDLPAYIESLSRLKNDSPLKVLTGLEVGIQSAVNTPPEGDFDYFIYSVHGVPGLTDINASDIWTLYLEEAIEAVREFEVPGFFGHIDFLRRYISGHRPLDNSMLLSELLKKLILYNIGIEINTSGWRAPYNEPSPQPWIIEKYLELGGRYVTIGSDSHRVEDVGSYVQRAIDLLKRLGAKEIFYCENKNYRSISISEREFGNSVSSSSSR